MHTHPALTPPSLSPSKPFLKWAGGKVRLLPQLLPLLPAGSRLIEPFVGAGSVFLGSSFSSYIINDANPDLVAVWAALQSRPRDYIERAQSFFTEANRNQSSYLAIRKDFNDAVDRLDRAIRMPYLNRFGFNGLYRVNSKGEFNVPYGKPARVPNMAVEEMASASLKLQRTTLLNGGFAAAIDIAGVGDVVYCDPPYLSSPTRQSFTSYTVDRFDLAQHERLLECCLLAVSRGATVLISNHDTAEVRGLYRGWSLVDVGVRRSIGAPIESRRIAREVVACLPAVHRHASVSAVD